MLAFSLDPAELLAQGAAPRGCPAACNNNRMLDAWLRINADGTATVFTGKVELGQGILTALWQIAAEELDLPLVAGADLSRPTPAQSPNEGQTAGSQSIENSGTALRLAGAEVRAMLVDLAAKKLGVPADTLTVTDGVIMTADGRKVTYGELAAEARSQARGDRARSRRSRRRPQDRRPVDAAPRHSRQGHRRHRLRAGHLRGRHGARPRGAAAALRLDARKRRRGRGRSRCPA